MIPGHSPRRRSMFGDRHHQNGDGGQATVELVFVLPVVVVFALAVVQVALVGRDQLLVWHAAREAGRQASVQADGVNAQRAAVAAAPGLKADRLEVRLSGGSVTGELVTVSLEYRSATDVPIVGAFIDDRQLTADVVFRVE